MWGVGFEVGGFSGLLNMQASMGQYRVNPVQL